MDTLITSIKQGITLIDECLEEGYTYYSNSTVENLKKELTEVAVNPISQHNVYFFNKNDEEHFFYIYYESVDYV